MGTKQYKNTSAAIITFHVLLPDEGKTMLTINKKFTQRSWN